MKHYPKPGARPRGDGGEQVPAVKPATGAELLLVWGALAMGLRCFWSLVISLF